jgi:CHAT domain-containing protein/tetratricopeptide (TPR) repeat protein
MSRVRQRRQVVAAELLNLDGPETLARRIDLLRELLTLVDRDLWPAQWAEAHLRLGEALLEQGRSDPSPDAADALVELRAAAEVFVPERYPREWAQTQTATGCAHLLLGTSDGVHGRAAITAFEKALRRIDAAKSPRQCATLHTNLGEAYRLRPEGDRASNVEFALAHGMEAIALWQQLGDAGAEAVAELNVGIALQERVLGDPGAHLELSREYLERALELATRSGDVSIRTKAHLALGAAYAKSVDPRTHTDDRARAVDHLRQALAELTPGRQPHEWSAAQLNLAIVLSEQGRGDEAVGHAENVLRASSSERLPAEWARAHDVLAQIWTERSDGAPDDRRAKAIVHHEAALKVPSAETQSAARRATLRRLGALYFPARQWEPAYTALAEALVIDESRWQHAATRASRESELAGSIRLHAQAAFCLLRLDRAPEALELLERGRGRLLRDRLTTVTADADIMTSERGRQVRRAWTDVRRLEDAVQRAETGLPMLCRRLGEERTELARLVEAIRRDHPRFLSTRLEGAEILSLAPRGGALVVLVVTEAGSAALVIPHGARTVGADHVVPLNSFTEKELLSLLNTTEGRQGWLDGYFEMRNDGPLDAWEAVIDQTTSRLWELVMGPIHGRLQALNLRPGASVVVMPPGGLALLPLHAAWRSDGGRRRYFLDDFTVSYAPSGHALAVARGRTRRRRARDARLLAVCDPEGDLAFARSEGVALRATVGDRNAEVLDGDAATRSEVLRRAAGCEYLHFACHAFYHWSNVERSGLNLADGTLTLDEIADLDFASIRLVTLSACESGLPQVFRRVSGNVFTAAPDEYLGITAAFLQVGVPAVVGSLWPVDDYATCLLMQTFYRSHLRGRMSVARALREAQRWVRDLGPDDLRRRLDQEPESPQLQAWREEMEADASGAPPLDHPYFWAGFIAVGAVS